MHTHKHTCVYPPSSTQTYIYICVACADKGQAGSSQSAPGSVLIKEQVAAPSMHPGMGQEKRVEADRQKKRGIKVQSKKKCLLYIAITYITTSLFHVHYQIPI